MKSMVLRVHLIIYDETTDEHGRSVFQRDFDMDKYFDYEIDPDTYRFFDHIEWNHYFEVEFYQSTSVGNIVEIVEKIKNDGYLETHLFVR